MNQSTLCVIGGGVVGLGLAGEVADLYDQVVLLERNEYCYREASYASGGMLAPFMEVEFKEEDVLQFNRKNLKEYDSFVERLRKQSGVPLDVIAEGSLYLALDERQESELERLHDYQDQLRLPVELLSADEAREREPSIGEDVRTGLYAPAEKHVNNRQLGLALYRRCRRKGVKILTGEPVQDVQYNPRNELEQVSTPRVTVTPDDVLLAAGSWTGRIPGLKPADRMPVRPVKGQALAIRPGSNFSPDGIVRSTDFYGVPHSPERFIVGATMEEEGFDDTGSAGAVLDLLDAARQALPGIKDQELLEHWTGLRPASRDNRPIIGSSSVTDNLYFATGHFRNGILQLPMTLKGIRHELQHGVPLEGLEPFSPGRFQRASCTSNQHP